MDNSLNFKEKKVQMLTLEMLRMTHKENDIYGQPTKGVYHYEVIDRLAKLCDDYGLNFAIKNVFAVQNNSRTMPGVVLLPQVEQQHGENAIQAHILRRVFANIEITDGATEEMTTNIAIAYHQEGIQIGLGPMVVACQNQTIMGSDRTFANFGKDKVLTSVLFEMVEDWLAHFFDYQAQDREKIERMRTTSITPSEVYKMIGMLTGLRVAKDSRHIKASPDTYPLNQSQITTFTENFLIQCQSKSVFTLWDIYNIATELYKADRMDVPSIIPQNVAMVDFLSHW